MGRNRNLRKAARAGSRGAVGERAQMGGGREVAIAPQHDTSQAALGPNNEWFGPGRPLPGIAPPASRGRRFDYNFGQNIMQSPRGDTMVSFQMLRALADTHDLTRLAIETRKDQMSRLRFGFAIVDDPQKDLSAEQKARADAYRLMLRRPDGKLFWVDWLRSLLEDLLVIDAPSIFVRRTMDEEDILGLYQIDGATIKPVIDQWGRTPEPPETAYQQWIKGMPAWNYTSQQLVYRPRNVRVHTVWGFSPVEQILVTINIALNRQGWQKAYFTNGNLPDSLIGVPSTWTPDQIRDFQDWFDGLLTGNTARRRGALFVPGEVAKSYVPTKDAEMFGGAEEWLARVVCFCFGISHQALVKEVNRATAGTAKEQALEDGLAPIMGWVKSLMDGILIDQFGETELEFQWLDDKEMDPKVQDEMWKARVDSGSFSRNEWRTAVGEKPRPEPEADMLLSSTTATPLSLDDQIAQQTKRTESGVFPAMPTEDPKKDPSESGGGDDEGGGGGASVGTPPPKKEEAGKSEVPFVKGAGGETGWSKSQTRAFRAVSVERPAVERRRKRLQTLVEGVLGTWRIQVTTRVRQTLEDIAEESDGRLGKADDPADHGTGDPMAASYATQSARIISVATEALGNVDAFIDAGAADLAAIAESTTRSAFALFGNRVESDLVDQVSERAVAWAEDRAAELIGRRVLADGSIIDNPNPRWAITESTREMIRQDITRILRENEGSDAIIRQLEDVHAFSPARAEMISRTEVANVNSRAAMDTYHEARDAGVELMKEWLLGSEPCDECQANADQGPIGLDEDFQSGDDSAPAHPNCVCATVPAFGDS